MSNYIEIIDEQGNERQYRVPDFASMTIAQWREVSQPHEGGDLEDLHHFSGVPIDVLKRLSVAQGEVLMDALIKAKIEAEKRAIEVNGEDYLNPQEITHEGITYTVPQDLERDTVFGQWVDLQAATDGATTDAECMADICAALLVEKGKKYEGLTVNLERLQTLPARVAMGMTAFFLGRSERLRNVMARYSSRHLMSQLLTQGQDGSSTKTGTDPG